MPTPPNNLPFEPLDSDVIVPPPKAPPMAAPPIPPMPQAPPPPTPVMSPPPAPTPAPVPAPSTPTKTATMPDIMAPKEPEDIFGDFDQSKKSSLTKTPVMPPASPASSGGGLKVALLIFVVLIIIAMIGGGVWYFVIRDPGQAIEETTLAPEVQPTTQEEQLTPEAMMPVNSVPAPIDNPLPPLPSNGEALPPTTSEQMPITQPPTESSTSPDTTAPMPVTTTPPGTRIPLPTDTETQPQQPMAKPDTDNDGLNDEREIELGLDPGKADTDGDELNDGDEVLKYGTNPLNKDTDGDGYEDGVEVKGGYNPRGTAKCSSPDCVI